jgi:hypothetical protein
VRFEKERAGSEYEQKFKKSKEEKEIRNHKRKRKSKRKRKHFEQVCFNRLMGMNEMDGQHLPLALLVLNPGLDS